MLMAGLTAAHADELEEFTNRVGMDYKRIVLVAAEPYLCQGECVNDGLCQAFTYVKPQVEAQEAICYLKDGVGTPQFSDCCTSGLRPDVTHALSESVIYQASQTAQEETGPSELTIPDPLDMWLSDYADPVFELASPLDPTDTRTTENIPAFAFAAASVATPDDPLVDYARQCDTATGITVPAFKCANGVLIPGQGIIPALKNNPAAKCNRPNVLGGECDPGSRFQVLPGRTADAVAVALCRKQTLPIAGNRYNDIAIIQHNKKNGATCFYQALANDETTLIGNVPAPIIAGLRPWLSSSLGWFSPKDTANIKCVRCHDSGAFVRSPYLAQLKKKPHALPSTADGYTNQSTPLKFVGTDFAKQRSWSIRLVAPDSVDSSCVACHRLAVSNSNNFEGSALEFAVVSTDRTQLSNPPHSSTSPIWMAPAQKLFKASALAAAKKYQKCAQDFHSLNGLDTLQNAPETAKSPPGCIMTPLVEPWQP